MIYVPEQEETNSQGVKRDPTRRRRRHLNPRAEGEKKKRGIYDGGGPRKRMKILFCKLALWKCRLGFDIHDALN